MLSQSLPSFRYRLSVVNKKSLNVAEQNCNVYWSKVLIQLTPKLTCAIYSTAVPLKRTPFNWTKQDKMRILSCLVRLKIFLLRLFVRCVLLLHEYAILCAALNPSGTSTNTARTSWKKNGRSTAQW